MWQIADGEASTTVAAAASNERLQFLINFHACEQTPNCELTLGQVQRATTQTVSELLQIGYFSTYAEVSQPSQGCWQVRCTVQVDADKMADANQTLYSFVTDDKLFSNRLRDGLVQARANYHAVMDTFNLTSLVPLSSGAADLVTSTRQAPHRNMSEATSTSSAALAPGGSETNGTMPPLVHNLSTTEPESETNQSGAIKRNPPGYVPVSSITSSRGHLRASTTSSGVALAGNMTADLEVPKGKPVSLISAILAFATGALLCVVIALAAFWYRRQRCAKSDTKDSDKEVEWLDVVKRTPKTLPTKKAFRPLFPNYWWNKGMLPGMGKASGQPPEFSEQVHVPPHVRDALQRAMDETFKRISTRDRRRELMPRRLRLLQVRRIENSSLWRHYAHQHLSISMQRTHKCTPVSGVPCDGLKALEQDVNEVYLWHGTSPSKADCIAQDGFQLKFAGTGAGSNMYGEGVYFAECSSKADEYAQDNPDSEEGVYCLLLCRVLLGEVLRMTAGGEATHGIVRSAMRSGAYNAVLGDRESAVGTYKEFVVYKEAQVYPEYLLLYQRETEEIATLSSSDASTKSSF